MNHEWQATGETKADGRPLWRCSHCSRTIAGHRVAATHCHGEREATKFVGAKDREPRRIGIDELPCVYRGAQVATVPCGLCGERDRDVAVFTCDRHLFAVASRVAKTERQRIDGVLPTACLGCAERRCCGPCLMQCASRT